MRGLFGNLSRRLLPLFGRGEEDLDVQLENTKDKTLQTEERIEKLRDVLAAKELYDQKRQEEKGLKQSIKALDKESDSKKERRDGAGANLA